MSTNIDEARAAGARAWADCRTWQVNPTVVLTYNNEFCIMFHHSEHRVDEPEELAAFFAAYRDASNGKVD